jgi:hypothetical protein
MYFTAYQIAKAEHEERNARYNRAKPAEGMTVEACSLFELVSRSIRSALSQRRPKAAAHRASLAHQGGAAK